MKKFLLISSLIIPAVSFAAEASEVDIEAGIKKATPEYVTITKREVGYHMEWTLSTLNHYVGMPFTEEKVNKGVVRVCYTKDHVYLQDKWYDFDFSNVVVLFKLGGQRLYPVSAEQKAMITEADLSIDQKEEVLKANNDARSAKLQAFVKAAKEAQKEDEAEKKEEAKQEEEVVESAEVAPEEVATQAEEATALQEEQVGATDETKQASAPQEDEQVAQEEAAVEATQEEVSAQAEEATNSQEEQVEATDETEQASAPQEDEQAAQEEAVVEVAQEEEKPKEDAF